MPRQQLAKDRKYGDDGESREYCETNRLEPSRTANGGILGDRGNGRLQLATQLFGYLAKPCRPSPYRYCEDGSLTVIRTLVLRVERRSKQQQRDVSSGGGVDLTGGDADTDHPHPPLDIREAKRQVAPDPRAEVLSLDRA